MNFFFSVRKGLCWTQLERTARFLDPNSVVRSHDSNVSVCEAFTTMHIMCCSFRLLIVLLVVPASKRWRENK